jgi:hypothetical protein
MMNGALCMSDEFLRNLAVHAFITRDNDPHIQIGVDVHGIRVHVGTQHRTTKLISWKEVETIEPSLAASIIDAEVERWRGPT